ncbi:hypothetical protein EDD85DRAFT_798158 [Armillaria nabsnona]|nr:hypothetical protein EDD85DRAFT_798158 [Armillaria nabsnona]
MAKPTDPAELAKVQAQDLYNATAVGIEDLLDDFPNPTWDTMRMDTWVIDTVTHWSNCKGNWSPTSIGSKDWYKLEYSLIARVPNLPMDKTLAKRSKAPSSQLLQDAMAPGSRTATPTPLPATPKCAPPVTLLTESIPSNQLQATPKPSTSDSGPSTKQATQPLGDNATVASHQTTQKKVKPMSIRSGNVTFLLDLTSLLHQQPGRNFKVGPPIHAVRSTPSVQLLLSRLLTVDATHSSVAPGPNPVQEGSIVLLPNDEEAPVQEDLVGEGGVEEVAGTNGEGDNMGGPDNEEGSPPPTKKARHLCQQPRISLPVPPAPTQDLHRSTRSHTSPVNPNATYLEAAQGSKADAKKTKKKKSVKGRDKMPEAVVPRKRARNDSEEDAPVADKSVTKRLKSKESKVDEVKVVRATPVIHKYGPGPSKPPPITLGVSGGGFGEKVPSTVKALKNGIKSIGVLKVDKDFSDFVEVNKCYWSKSVAPFVGEQYTTACDHCRRLGTQCHKLLTHTIKCVCGHYSKLPCKVNRVPALNPVEHYCPQGYDMVNTFEATVNTIKANNTAIAVITQQFLAGLNVIAYTNSIRAQTFHLCGCLAPIDEDEDDNDGEDEEYEAPDNVAEGISGPSRKQKNKSG